MIRTILFDLDGTILDTNELILQSFLHVLEGVTPEPVTREKIIPHMGGILADQIRFFSGRENVEDLVQKYRQFNIRMHDELTREFPHVYETLSELRERGIRLGVVTSKYRKTAEMGLRLCRLDQLMDTIVSVDDVTEPKPSPAPIRLALQRLGEKASDAMMVGDTQYDIQSAQRAGVVSVGVGWSLKGPEFLRRYHPDYLIDDIRELLSIVEQRG
jgi:pyrophosphatase PpaX